MSVLYCNSEITLFLSHPLIPVTVMIFIINKVKKFTIYYSLRRFYKLLYRFNVKRKQIIVMTWFDHLSYFHIVLRTIHIITKT